MDSAFTLLLSPFLHISHIALRGCMQYFPYLYSIFSLLLSARNVALLLLLRSHRRQ